MPSVAVTVPVHHHGTQTHLALVGDAASTRRACGGGGVAAGCAGVQAGGRVCSSSAGGCVVDCTTAQVGLEWG